MEIIDGALDTLQFFYFPANGSRKPDVFQPKTFPISREIIPQNFSSLGFTVSKEFREQTSKQTDTFTDRLALLQSDKQIEIHIIFKDDVIRTRNHKIYENHGLIPYPPCYQSATRVSLPMFHLECWQTQCYKQFLILN